MWLVPPVPSCHQKNEENCEVYWPCIAPGSCADHVLGQHLRNSFAQSTHSRAWLAHRICEFYIDENFKRVLKYIPKATSAPPRAGTIYRLVYDEI
jgi:hypothetical protein